MEAVGGSRLESLQGLLPETRFAEGAQAEGDRLAARSHNWAGIATQSDMGRFDRPASSRCQPEARGEEWGRLRYRMGLTRS